MSPEGLANVWKKFCEKKLSATELEQFEREYNELSESREEDKLDRKEFEDVVRHMKNGKATGSDGIPAEVFKHSAVPKEMLFKFLKKVWDKEYVPAALAVGIFVMIFKKGSHDDCSNYRCICLLNHDYKILSVVLLKRLVAECDGFLTLFP